ncbi:hypothetical protein [Amycolatopsis sp. YIM 10]|uniref:hypothetical protein n=1 Tax=Amycolatopsis sp. YIM 10 TaxID=2653857 RepID=UPI001290535F|nr:hypothetical protein [Amycolatopsis sp. YIM 10]QFU86737.1 hypothetical protein YIM_07630 [Amycolatopsis sp. YIM 10]
MQDRKKRLVWTVLAVLLPGPWTPVIVLAYLLGRASERDLAVNHYGQTPPYPPCPPPDPYACVSPTTRRNLYGPPR